MDQKYGDGWDKGVFTFLKRFEKERYLFQPPKAAEAPETVPDAQKLSILTVPLSQGMEDTEAIAGMVGLEMTKFRAFLSLDVKLEEPAGKPQEFSKLNLDAKYMVCPMLASEINGKNLGEYVGLVKTTSEDSKEWLVILT